MSDRDFMMAAIEQAECARRIGDVPVGCVIVKDERIIARAHNRREADGDPTAHAEMLAIRSAARALGDWRLNDCTLYVTLEPCPMCAGAISQSRIGRVVYGAPDPAYGCAGSVYRIPEDPAFGHFCRCDGGVMADECRMLIRYIFNNKE